jgi:hypothetical protein
MLKAKLDATFNQTKSGREQDWREYEAEINASSANWAKVIEGATTLSTSAYKWA